MQGIRSSRKGDGRRLAAIFALCLALLPFSSARAGSFQVNPVNIELVPGRRTTEINVRNADDRPVSVRLRLYRWTQVEGEDVYSETNDLVASPPIFTIPANGTQLVRIGPRGQSARGAYRVVLEEIPGKAQGTGVRVALRLNLPLYIVTDRASVPALSWSAWRNGTGEVVIEARNNGARHSQIIELGTVDQSGNFATLSKQMGVVLPMGSTKRWKVGKQPELVTGSTLRLTIQDGLGQTSHAAVTLQQRYVRTCSLRLGRRRYARTRGDYGRARA